MTENKAVFFNGLAGSWDNGSRTPAEKYRRIVKEAAIGRGQRILDVGTGTGVLIPYLLEAETCGMEIFAIDYATEMIKKFQEKHFPDNVKPLVMDIHETHFEDTFFDRVIANACYPHFEDREKALREVHRVLRERGIFIISHPTGRRHVNELHKRSNTLITEDIIPPMRELSDFAASCGFDLIKGYDEEDFFCLSFSRRVLK